VDKAASAYQDGMRWRKENHINSVLEEDFSEFEAKFPIYFDPPDKYGRPVIRVLLEDWDSHDIVLNDKNNQRYKRAAFKLAESIEECIRKHSDDTNGEVYQGVFVLDCTTLSRHVKNVGVKNMYAVLRLLKEVVTTLAANYPGFPAAIYVLNATTWFTSFFSAVKPFLHKNTLANLEIHGTNQILDWKSKVY